MSMDLLTIHTFTHPDEGQIEAVDGRELHRVLKIQKDYSNWIKAQIESAGLVEGEDYRREVIEKTNAFSGARVVERIDYWLRTDAAKHIAMMSRTAEGKMVRQYLIDRDKKLRQMERQGRAVLPDFTDPVAAARAWADEVEAKKRAEAQLEASRPKVLLYDALMNADGHYTLQNAARALGQGPNKFCQWLVDQRYMFRQGGVLVPYVQWSGDSRLFVVKTVVSEDGMRTYIQSFVTPKGLDHLARALGVVSPSTPVTSAPQYRTESLHT